MTNKTYTITNPLLDTVSKDIAEDELIRQLADMIIDSFISQEQKKHNKPLVLDTRHNKVFNGYKTTPQINQ